MTGVKKKALERRKTRKKYVVDHFSLWEEKGLFSTDSLNCDCADGSLRRGIGIQLLRDKEDERLFAYFPQAAQGAYPVPLNEGTAEDAIAIYLVAVDGTLYFVNRRTGGVVEKYALGGRVDYASVKGADKKVYHLFAGDSAAVGGTGETLNLLTSGDLVGGCACGGRFFVGKSSATLLYSAPFAPYNFSGDADEGGELYLPAGFGEIVALAATEEVYIFLERGIFRLQVGAEGKDFLLEDLGYAGGRICPRSAVALGGGVFFLSREGAWRVEGKRIERVCTHLPLRPMHNICYVGVCEDLALIDYQDEKGYKRVAIAADGKTGFFTERFVALGGNGFCFTANMCYRFCKDALGATYQNLPYFQSPKRHFGYPKTKQLRKLRLLGEGNVHVKIENERGEEEYTLSCVEGEAETRLFGRGREFRIRMELEEGSRVEGLEIEFDCVEEKA